MADLLYVHDGSAFDAAIVTLLETEHTVTQHDVDGGADPIPGDAGDYDCIVMGNGVSDSEVGTSYRDLAVPVVAAASSSSWTTALELTSTTTSTGSSTTIVVTDDAHEIAVAAGLANGNQTIAESNHSIFRANGLGPEADPIAYHFQDTRHTFWAYESGAEMANSVLAPARRVALGFIVAADTLTALGEACLLESVTWAIGAAASPSAALTGTVADGATEAMIVDGGETLIVTLTADTWVADDGTFAAQRQAIIDGLDSAQSEATGWNAEVRDKEVVGAVVRTSDTVVTITLTASAAYDITADETITVTIPAAALVTSAGALEADETFLISAESSGAGSPLVDRSILLRSPLLHSRLVG
jgi:hypothetical protein